MPYTITHITHGGYEMEGAFGWILLVVGLVVGLAGALFGFRKWRKAQGDETEEQGRLYDLIEGVILALVRVAKEAMQDIPLAEVEAAARAVYRRFIAGKKVANLVSEDAFVAMVVNRWEQVAGVEAMVTSSVLAVRALAAPPTGPPAGA